MRRRFTSVRRTKPGWASSAAGRRCGPGRGRLGGGGEPVARGGAHRQRQRDQRAEGEEGERGVAHGAFILGFGADAPSPLPPLS